MHKLIQKIPLLFKLICRVDLKSKSKPKMPNNITLILRTIQRNLPWSKNRRHTENERTENDIQNTQQPQKQTNTPNVSPHNNYNSKLIFHVQSIHETRSGWNALCARFAYVFVCCCWFINLKKTYAIQREMYRVCDRRILWNSAIDK